MNVWFEKKSLRNSDYYWDKKCSNYSNISYAWLREKKDIFDGGKEIVGYIISFNKEIEKLIK